MSAVLAPSPYYAGHHVGNLGLSLSLNPHRDGTADHQQWELGWRAAVSANAKAASERITKLNAGKPEPVTSMLDPHYWDEADAEYRRDIRYGLVP
jgi:hypothetical protein